MAKNSQTICRACLRKCKTRFVSLQDAVPLGSTQEVVSYAQAYTTCTRLDLQVGLDGMPETLCNSCSRDLQCAYDFWIKARESFEKLSVQLQAQKQEKVARAVTPSEFTLPDNNDTVTFVHADADSMEAKDPLLDSDSEDQAKPELDMLDKDLQSDDPHTFPELMDDSDDDKPLIEFAVKKETNCMGDFDFAENIRDSTKPPGLNDDDDFVNDNSGVNDEVMDPMFSPESYIFPKGRYKCSICQESYFTTVGLNAHMEVHQTKKKHSHSPQIRKAIKPRLEIEVTDTDVQSHTSNQQSATDLVETTTGEENEETKESQAPQNEPKTRKTKEPKPKRMLPCNVCGKHFISASKLRYHMVMHTGERNYLCTMCPNAYTTIYGLRHHIRSHTGERPYECKFCGDRFLRTTTLKSHQRRHTGERPYGCDICGKRFIQHSSMATHMRLNHMDKTIQCPHCVKKYARQTDLNAHLLSHTGYKPFRCKLCPSRFVRQSNLNKHMNQQHAKEPAVTNMAENSNANPVDFVDNCVDFIGPENIGDMTNEQPTQILGNDDFNDFVTF